MRRHQQSRSACDVERLTFSANYSCFSESFVKYGVKEAQTSTYIGTLDIERCNYRKEKKYNKDTYFSNK